MTIPKMQLTVRKASLSDAKSIAAMGSHVFAVTFGHSVSREDLESYLSEAYTAEAVAKDIAHPEKKMIVATDESGVIRGFVAVGRGASERCLADLEDTGELHRLYVDVSVHGQGVGTLLVKSVEQVAKEAGVKNMWLGVWEENYKAIKAYERWGYATVGDHDFWLGTVAQRDLIMTKAL